jgi:hypothetical protein
MLSAAYMYAYSTSLFDIPGKWKIIHAAAMHICVCTWTYLVPAHFAAQALRASNNIIESVGTMAASTLPLRPPSSPLASSGFVQFLIHCLQHIAHLKLLAIMYPGLCIPEESLEPNMRQIIFI